MRYIVKKKKTTGSTENQPRTGRPKVLTVRQRRQVVKQALKNPSKSAQNLADDLASCSGKHVALQTIRNVLHNEGIRGRRPVKKPFISEVNRKKRLDFATKYVNEPLDFWKKIIFSDESKFEVFKPANILTIWRKNKTALDKRNILKTVKGGGGNVMVWGCMAYSGVGNLEVLEGIMTARSYVEVLRRNLKSSAINLGLENDYYFQQDIDPKHTANLTKEWLLYNAPRRLLTPPQSPDLNPIENLWHILDRKVRQTKITSKEHLKQVLIESWNDLSVETLNNLVESMPRRLQAVINANGMFTKY